MRDLTGLGEADWLALATATVLIMVVARSRRPLPGTRLGPLLVVPAAASLLGLAALTTLRWSSFRGFADGRLAGAAIVLVVVVLLAYVVVDFWFGRVLAPVLAARTRRHDAWIAALLAVPMVVVVAGVVVVTSGATRVDAEPAVTVPPEAISSTTSVTIPAPPPVAARHRRFQLGGSHGLPGSPMAVVVLPYRDLGYVSLGEGSVVKFALSDLERGAPSFIVVADGLEYPRGLAVVGDTLIIAELGVLPCADPFPSCRGGEAESDGDRHRGEVRIIEESSGRLTAFAIAADGSLSDGRTIVDGLPYASTDHGINGLVADGDGVLLSIGNIDQLFDAPEVVASLQHPRLDLLGTVVRVTLDGELSVVATGLRNVYGLVTGGGELWGVDNDGPTFRGWREEEVVSIQEGADYGFPDDGSYAPFVRRTQTAIWVTDAVGSAGLAWTENVGLSDALLTGNCGRVDMIDVVYSEGVYRVGLPVSTPVAVVQGCVTGIATYGPDRVVVAVFQPGFSVLSLLYVVDPPDVAP